ncbi:kinase-like protein [Daedalea quercina L-15889]|uniref:Kinase-like protein n=1 Tax=Daedalea quercina L-15889 TaxID=1314783 RepID=A0A165TW33_9APHY|nr:kinase-like protein [Daedalea quercina L-15889]
MDCTPIHDKLRKLSFQSQESIADASMDCGEDGEWCSSLCISEMSTELEGDQGISRSAEDPRHGESQHDTTSLADMPLLPSGSGALLNPEARVTRVLLHLTNTFPEMHPTAAAQVNLSSSKHQVLEQTGNATASPQDVFNIMRAATSSKYGLRVLEDFDDDCEMTINLLDTLLDEQAPGSHLHAVMLQALHQLCIRYDRFPRSLVLPSDSVHFDASRVQGVGAYSITYIGQWQQQVIRIKTVNHPSRDYLPTMLRVASREAILWRHLSHPNIIPFYGFEIERFNIGIVSTWMPQGNIRTFLQRSPTASRPQLVLDIARGLQYLHSDGIHITHGALKPTNVLVDGQDRACLSDYGLYPVVEAQHTGSLTRAGGDDMVTFYAPEVFCPENYGISGSDVPTSKGDIYSFSLVTWEIFSGKVPFSETRREVAIVRRIIAGDRPARPREATVLGLSDSIWSMIEQCWSAEPSTRPTISQVIATLEDEWGLDTRCPSESAKHDDERRRASI